MSVDTSEDADCFQYFTDSHCHVKSVASTADTADDSVDNSSLSCGIKRAVFCGTHPDIDWSLIESLVAMRDNGCRTYPTPATTERSTPVIIPGFGIHPWFVPYNREEEKGDDTIGEKEEKNSANSVTSDNTDNNGDNNVRINVTVGEDSYSSCCCSTGATSGNISTSIPAPLQQQVVKGEVKRTTDELLSLLEDKLRRYPNAIVGEIGLDKLRGPPQSVQLALFTAQMRLAAQYNRPVSVHCVRSFGTMLQTLRELPAEDTPPAIVLHGFTGTLEFAKSVMAIRKKRQVKSVDLLNRRGTHKAEPLPVFFGVGSTTSLRVKGFAAHTLPFLLQQRRVLLETDAHHTLRRGRHSASHTPPLSRRTTTTSTRAMTHVGIREKEEISELVSPEMTSVVERLVWDPAGCAQLRELGELVCRLLAVMEGTLRRGCEEAFEEAFALSAGRRGDED